jgi:hypothetical protein
VEIPILVDLIQVLWLAPSVEPNRTGIFTTPAPET